MDLEKSKISRPKKAFIPKNDCLDKELKDKTPLGPQLPQKKPIMNDYEKRNHVEKIKCKPIKYISQPDNSFNFNPPQKEKTKKRMVTEQIPSNYYQKMQNSKNAYNHWLNAKKITKKYEDKARKDNLNEIFRTNTEGNIYNASGLNISVDSTTILDTDYRGTKITENYLIVLDCRMQSYKKVNW